MYVPFIFSKQILQFEARTNTLLNSTVEMAAQTFIICFCQNIKLIAAAVYSGCY